MEGLMKTMFEYYGFTVMRINGGGFLADNGTYCVAWSLGGNDVIMTASFPSLHRETVLSKYFSDPSPVLMSLAAWANGKVQDMGLAGNCQYWQVACWTQKAFEMMHISA